MSAGPALQVEHLSVRYGGRDGGAVRAVDDVSLTVAPGEVLGIVGESGSGKSTLALALIRLLPPGGVLGAGGRILLRGNDLAALSERALRDVRGRDIAMIFQDPMTSLHPQFSVGAQIVEALECHGLRTGHAARTRAIELLEQVRIPAPARVAAAYPHQLSGGMRQRVMIAMAIAAEPAVLIADEPTTALDVTVGAQIAALLLDLRDRLCTAILFITHDLALLARLADRVAVLYAGRLVETGEATEIYARPVHPYTRALLNAALRIDRPTRQLRPILGAPPNVASLPPGCAFAPRCPDRAAVCTTSLPALHPVGAGHAAACLLAARRVDA